MKARLVQPALSLCLLALLLAGGGASQGATEANPYQAISKRNAFDLKPIPPPDAQTEAPPPPSNIKLSGIIRVAGVKQAMLVVLDGKNNNYLSLAEEEREGAIRIVKIDEDSGTVEIYNGPTKVRLNFEDNKVAAAAPPPGAGGPGGSGGPGAKPGMPLPPGIPQPPGMNGTLPANRIQPTGGPRLPGQNSDGGVTIPTRTTRTSSTYVAPSGQNSQTAEQSVLLMQAYQDATAINNNTLTTSADTGKGGSAQDTIQVPAPPMPPIGSR